MDLGRQLRVIVVEPDDLAIPLLADDPAAVADVSEKGREVEPAPLPIRADRP
jgi:hypothetical protein